MASQFAAEGNATQNEIQHWLSANKIDLKYAEAFDALGIKSTDDLKLITTQDEFQGLMDEISKYFKNIDVTFMDRIKLKKAWNAFVPMTQNKSAQTIPMGPKERESLELLAKYMQFIQKEMIQLDEFTNGSVVEKYCNEIRKESKLLQQSIAKREAELIQQTQSKFNEVNNEYKTKQKQLETLALAMNNIKKKCDNALQMNEYNQLEQRRNIICSTVESVKQSMNDAMTQCIECSMKTIKLDLSDHKTLKDKINNFGKVFVQYPFEIALKTVTLKRIDTDTYGIKVLWEISNAEKSDQNTSNMDVSVMKYDEDEKKNEVDVDDPKQLCVVTTKRLQGDLSKTNCAELQINGNILQGNGILAVRINVLNRIVEKRYKNKLKISDRVDFVGWVNWYQDVKFSCKEEDDAMDKACNDKYKGTKAATDLQIIEGKIDGLQKPTENKHRFGHSGGGDLWRSQYAKKSGNRTFGRKGWDRGTWPLTNNNYGSGYWGNNGLTIAVRQQFTLESV